MARRHQPAGRDALEPARDDERGNAVGERRTAAEAARKRPSASSSRRLRPCRSPSLPHGGVARGGGDDVGGDDPGDVRHASEVGGDRGQRGGQDRLVEHRGEHRQHDRGERDANALTTTSSARRHTSTARSRNSGGDRMPDGEAQRDGSDDRRATRARRQRRQPPGGRARTGARGALRQVGRAARQLVRCGRPRARARRAAPARRR